MKTHWVSDHRIAILRPKGDLHSEPETAMFATTGEDLAAQGNRALLIDVGDVAIISSVGLGSFVRIHHAYRDRDGKVVLCNLSNRNRTLLEVTRLLELFDEHENELRAIHALEAWLAEHAAT